ncbi:hypothetical protein [Alkalilacustris brevis]|uniref:hypothetical protein n=1 Tax=Alkalilacustris brevis TaxID=2026338 RepID=UPI000E0CD253|nr:hypothetical protein [Alkalilacustris brevis]
MNRSTLAAMVALGLLAGCGGLSSLNPFNWFGSSEEVTLTPEGGYALVDDNRPLVSQVTEMAVEPFPGGAIVRAVGLPPRQGWWDAELIPENDGRAVDGVLRFRFVVAAPRQPTREGTPMSREVSVGHYVSDHRLAGVRRIEVIGAQNARSSNR